MGLVVFEMIRIHPYQNVYFNRLVDRTTPEYLRSQYFMASGVEYREGLEYLLKRYPAGPLAVTAAQSRGANFALKWNGYILPPVDRERIVVALERPDFILFIAHSPLRPGLCAPKVYDNTILTVRKMLLTAEDADTEAYRAAHQATVATAPLIRAAVAVYLQDNMLVYVARSYTSTAATTSWG